jgi:hypothetical protein
MWLRRAVCALIAYFFAFQLVAATAQSTAMMLAPQDLQSICHALADTDSADQSSAPVNSDQHGLCRICILVSSATMPPAVTVDANFWTPITTVLRTEEPSLALPTSRHDPRLSQGPPSAI